MTKEKNYGANIVHDCQLLERFQINMAIYRSVDLKKTINKHGVTWASSDNAVLLAYFGITLLYSRV